MWARLGQEQSPKLAHHPHNLPPYEHCAIPAACCSLTSPRGFALCCIIIPPSLPIAFQHLRPCQSSRVESCVITHSRLLPLKTACPAKSLIPGAPRLGQEPSIHLPLNLDLPNFPHVLHAALFPAPRQSAVIAIGFRVLRIRGFPTSFIPCLQVTTTLVFTCITTLTNTPPIARPSKVAAHRNISQHIANPTAYAPSHHDAAIA